MSNDIKSLLRRLKKKKYVKILQIAGVVVAAGAIILCLAVLYFAKTIPSIQEIGSQQIGQSTKIYDGTCTVLLYDIDNGQHRTLVPFDQISQSVKDATIAIEDQNFYNEPAFDIKGIIRALFVDIT